MPLRKRPLLLLSATTLAKGLKKASVAVPEAFAPPPEEDGFALGELAGFADVLDFGESDVFRRFPRF